MASVLIKEDTKRKVKSIAAAAFAISTISQKTGRVTINEVLPFRIRITNIQVPGYSASSPAPIGIAIIGLNNYIL
jgi:hypothetical protein